MFRIALLIEYDGTNYYGWQTQKNSNLPTVQQKIESAITKVANHPIATICAGRTDAKVHAKGQVVHFNTIAKRHSSNWIFGINSYLPKDIRVLNSYEVPINFDARKSALYRTYNYIIYNSKISPGIFRNYVSWENQKLNVEFMQQAAKVWEGEHDFRSFRGKDCQSKTTIRRVYHINCYQEKKLIIITITANAFLKHMVRNMVGVLVVIGKYSDVEQGKKKAKEVLLAKNRVFAATTADPQGLYLISVGYPENFNISIKNDTSDAFYN